MKRILLIEDNPKHARNTKKILEKLSDMYSIVYKLFAYMSQNGQNRESKYKEIYNYILNEITNDSFDILMIDMLLGGDCVENPLGLQLIKDLKTSLENKSIIVYTEMSASELDLIKTYNKSTNNCLKIVMKPDLQVLNNKVDCVGKDRKDILVDNHADCKNKQRCTSEEKLLCDMRAIYYEMEKK